MLLVESLSGELYKWGSWKQENQIKVCLRSRSYGLVIMALYAGNIFFVFGDIRKSTKLNGIFTSDWVSETK